MSNKEIQEMKMGTPTNKIITQIRSTGHGSDYYGVCEICGKHMSECFFLVHKREYQRQDGSLYYSPASAGSFGHIECLQEDVKILNDA
jgi:hypothetical protein